MFFFSALSKKNFESVRFSHDIYYIFTVPDSPAINYEVINLTAIRIYWNISGDVNGFLINITSSGLPTVTQQLTDGSVREFVYNEILPEITYDIEIRGYTQLLGQASGTTYTVRLEGILLILFPDIKYTIITVHACGA